MTIKTETVAHGTSGSVATVELRKEGSSFVVTTSVRDGGRFETVDERAALAVFRSAVIDATVGCS